MRVLVSCGVPPVLKTLYVQWQIYGELSLRWTLSGLVPTVCLGKVPIL